LLTGEDAFVFAQQVVGVLVFVIYSNFDSAVRQLLIEEGEGLFKAHVFAASLQSERERERDTEGQRLR